jgi:hypothetical protein
MRKPALVTSAAGGNQGKTGRHVSEMLLERGIPVRAFVRKIDERSDQLKARGAEIFLGDFLDVRSVQKAARDVSSIYFAYPVQDGLADATAAMAYAAREQGVSRLVNLVMYQSSTDAPTPRMRQNYLSEQVFEWAGIGAVHIRATVFFENVARLVRSSLPAQGAIRLGRGKYHLAACLCQRRGAHCRRSALKPTLDCRRSLSSDRDGDFLEGNRGHLRSRARQGRALPGSHGRAVAQ